MDALKALRRAARASFTRTHTALMKEMQAENASVTGIKAGLSMLTEKMSELNVLNTKILELMSAEEMEADMTTSDEYRLKFHNIKTAIETGLGSTRDDTAINQNRTFQALNQTLENLTEVFQRRPPGENQANQTLNQLHEKHYNYPRVDIPTFSGEIKEWLQYWSLFKTIHEDELLPKERKFYYLVQSMVKGSRAAEVVNSYPPTADNYDKAIQAIKNRFGKDELIIEVYVRELLRLVLNNTLHQTSEVKLGSLYDQLETQLRALDSLGVNSDMHAAILYPLVESALPTETLRAWQRHAAGLQVDTTKQRLEKLMEFLQAEVEAEERIAMAAYGFGLGKSIGKTTEETKKSPKDNNNKSVATAAGLLATTDHETTPNCIFCDDNHDSGTCKKDREMTLDQRQNVAKEKKACFNCLLAGHSYKTCRYKGKCGWCGHRHLLIMCRQMAKDTLAGSSSNSTKEVKEASLANVVSTPEVFLQTLQVKLISRGKEKIVRAIVDTGSQHSYVSESLAEQLSCEVVGSQKTVHLLFGGIQSEPQSHKTYRLHLKSLDNSYACTFVAYSQAVICRDIPKTTDGPWISELKARGVTLTDIGFGQQPISLLIGVDVIGKLYTGRVENLPSGPTAVQTHLGWTLLGKNKLSKRKHQDSTLLVTNMFVQDATLSQLWNLDILGIEDHVQVKSKGVHQQEVLEQFRDTVKVRKDNRYEVRLPWKENHPPLVENRDLAQYRLENSLKTLKTKNLTHEYEKVFDNWLAEGIIEKVPTDEINKPGHYLPHRPVIKEKSTTPIRPVFDASARKKGHVSLNQCLETGPNLIEQIPSLLLRFRQRKFGIIADIKKAFLQISVEPEDRNSLRFLWKRSTSPNTYELYRHCRVVFGVSSSPFLLGATIELHLDRAIQSAEVEEDKVILQTLRRSFYVDNCVASVHEESELSKFKEIATRVMEQGGFDLRGWEYTGQDVQEQETPLLGLIWDTKGDTLSLTEAVLDQEIPGIVTKRQILSSAQKIFDPIGMVCPVVLCPKILLQKLWNSQIDWDTPLEGDIKDTFLQWQRELNYLRGVNISRWALGSPGDRVSLHLFVDASKNSYAAVLYSRVESSRGIHVHLLQAKSRVAPKEKITIPRLELLAATIGAPLLHSIIQTMDPLLQQSMEKYCWTDSTIVLSWIRRQSSWGVFVWNRVQEIRKLTSIDDWSHVPGALNPADLPSRGCTAQQLVELKWWEGPSWLKNPRDTWPTTEPEVDEEIVTSELKKTSSNSTQNKRPADCVEYNSVLSNVSTEQTNDLVSTLLQRQSRYTIIVRVWARVKRFVSNLRRPKGTRPGQALTTEEIDAAEASLFYQTQQTCLAGKDDPRLASMTVFVDKNGLLRLKSLIENRLDTTEFRYPIILDRQHILVTRLIEHTHRRLSHAGTDMVMNALRERFWLLSCRRAVTSVLRRCIRCNRYRSKRLETPLASLPEDRVRNARVFEVTGVDFAGPLYLKDGSKVWICLFTCAIFRAIHLELASSLSTENFREAFRRFVSRRGRPEHVYTDNGTNFVGTSKMLRGIDWERVEEYGSVEKIQWHFNPPSAAWWGGWWERLVRTVEDILKRVLGKSSLTYEQLITVLCDCEAVINSRPLTYLAEDPCQLAPLTPAFFLHDVPSAGVPDLDAATASTLNKKLRHQQQLRDHFRERFRIEYLGQLARGVPSPKQSRTTKVGDVVVIGNDQSKRLDWPLGKIVELFPGRDGVSRVARVKTQKGELVRPLQRLYPLEVDDQRQAFLEDSAAASSAGDSTMRVESPSNVDAVLHEPTVRTSTPPIEPISVLEEDAAESELPNVADASEVASKTQISELTPREERKRDHISRRGRTIRLPKRFQD